MIAHSTSQPGSKRNEVQNLSLRSALVYARPMKGNGERQVSPSSRATGSSTDSFAEVEVVPHDEVDDRTDVTTVSHM